MVLQGAALLPYGNSGAMWEKTRRRAAATGVWAHLGLAFEEFVSAAKQAASINARVAGLPVPVNHAWTFSAG